MSPLLTDSLFALGAATGPFYAFSQSDALGKCIVIFLMFGSIVTWTIMVEKWIYLSRATKEAKKFKELFRLASTALSAFSKAERNRSPLAAVYTKGVKEILGFYGYSPERAMLYGVENIKKERLNLIQVETVRSVLDRNVADGILELEDQMGWLATAVSCSPFCGLFGTVWGIMMAFCGMAAAGHADIASMAPGIASALLCTVVGLVVAIPSLIGYNMLTNKIVKLTVYLDNFAEEFLTRLKLEQHDQDELEDKADQRDLEEQELERRDTERRDLERRDAERRELERRDAERREIERLDAERRELDRRDAERRELERRDAERRRELEWRDAERRKSDFPARERLEDEERR